MFASVVATVRAAVRRFQYIQDDNNDKRRKHINIKFHYVREQWKSNELKPQYIQTDDNIADVFTKPLVEVKFVPFRDKLLGENKTGWVNSILLTDYLVEGACCNSA